MIPSRVRSAIARAAKAKESYEERKFVLAARKRKWKTRKMNGAGQRNWMDQLVALPFGAIVFIEFKREGEGPRAGQAELIKELVDMGHYVFLAYSSEGALQLCESVIEEKKRGMGTLTVSGEGPRLHY